MNDDYDDNPFAGGYLEEQQRRAAQSSIVGAVDEDPEKVARSIQLGDATGVPAPLIHSDLDNNEKQLKVAANQGLVDANPYLQEYLTGHPMAAGLSHDDLGPLDEASHKIGLLSSETGLGKFLRGDQSLFGVANLDKTDEAVSKAFVSGYGEQPLGLAMLQRPGDAEWALSHPEVAALTGLSIPVEFMARATSGLLAIGHEGTSQLFGKKFADDLFGMAEMEMMRGDIGVKSAGGGATGALGRMEQNTALAEKMHEAAQALQLTDPWTRIGREPPPGLHPLIDKGKEIQAKTDAKALDEALQESIKTATRERSPEFFANFARTHNLEGKELGVDSAAIRAIYGDKTPLPDDNLLGWVPDLDKKLAAAELTGEDVRIPMADWLANVDPEVHKALHDDLRLREAGVTINETKIGKGQEIEPPKITEALDAETGEIELSAEPKVAKPIEGPKPEPIKPKTVGPDHIQQIRGAAGFEPMFSVGDRKIELRRLLPPEKTGEQLATEHGLSWADMSAYDRQKYEQEVTKGRASKFGPEQGFHDFDIHDEIGDKVGSINLSKQGKQIYIEMIQAGTEQSKFYQPNFLGPSLIREVKRQLKAEFPDVETITGHRVSGAREKAGSWQEKSAIPVVKLDLDSNPQSFRDLLSPYWENLGSGVEALYKPESLWGAKEQEIAGAIREEAQRIAPGVNVDVVHAIHDDGVQGTIRGTYLKYGRDGVTPEMLISLEAKDPVGVLRHEAIHHFRGMGLIKPEEWAGLERVARDEGWIKKFNVDSRYPTLSMPLKLEEAIAEGYRSWKLGDTILKDDGVFQRIKDFMESVLRRIKEISGKDLSWEELFKEIDSGRTGRREDFTSATPEELAAAPAMEEPKASVEDEGGFGLYDKGKTLGVTQSHMERMEKLISKRNTEDFEALQRRAEQRQRRRSNVEYKTRRATLRDVVSDDLKSRPDIAMDELFSKNKIKLNPSYLTEDQRARLPKDYLQTKDGVSPDELAPYFGYTSGDALVERLGIFTEDRRRAGMSQRDYFNRLVDVETDRRLNQEFGNREQNILDEAKDQALSETQLNLTHEETLAFALKAGQEPQFTKDQVRDMVRQVFNETPVGQISSDRLLQTAGKIGKKIEEAGAKGDWAAAYRLSQQRNHSMILAKMARDYEKERASLDRTAKTFRKREVPNVPAEYTNWVHDILVRVGKPINRSIQDLAENIERASDDTLGKFKDSKEKEWMGNRELPIADFLLEPGFHKPLDQLTHQEFMGLKNSIDTLVKAGRDEKKIYAEGETRDREQLMSEFRGKLQTFPAKPGLMKPGAFAQWPRLALYGSTTKETTFNRWDRGDPLGIFNKFLSYPLAAAANGVNTLERAMAKAYKELSKPKDLDKLVDEPFVDPSSRTEANPNGAAGQWPGGFKRSNVLQMLNHMGNKGNWEKLARGYGADPEALKGYMAKYITKEDVERAQGLGTNIFKELIKKADNVYERMTGATIQKINLEPIIIDTLDGPVATAGWYHPLKADPIRKTVWKMDENGTWSQVAQGKRDSIDNANAFHFSTSNGYTKSRTGAIYPLDLEFNMTPTTINQMIHDINFKEPIFEAQKILLDPRFKEDVAKHYGKEYADGFAPYLRKLAGASSIDSANLSSAKKASEYLRQNVISTYIGFNPFTMMKHGPTAWVMSMREVGAGNFAEAVKDIHVRGPDIRKDIKDFMKDKAEEVNRRERNWQDTIRGQGNEITGATTAREQVVQMASAGVAWSDMVTARPTWWAAYNKYRADGLSTGESINLAERSIRRAHGSTAETNLPPAVAGSGDVLHPWLTSVYGFFGTAMQRRIETAHKMNDTYHLVGDREFKAAAAKSWDAFGDFMTYVVWPTIVEEFVTGIGTDDHRGWGAKAISGMTMGVASSALYLRDLVHGLVSGHEPGVGLASSAAHDVGNVFRDFAKGREALNRQHAGKTIGDIMTLAGEATGMVPKIVGNATRYSINVATGQEKPKSVTDVLLGATKGTQERRQEK